MGFTKQANTFYTTLFSQVQEFRENKRDVSHALWDK